MGNQYTVSCRFPANHTCPCLHCKKVGVCYVTVRARTNFNHFNETLFFSKCFCKHPNNGRQELKEDDQEKN